MPEQIKFSIVDVSCPICGSDKTRSKVHNKGVWWYICDNNVDHVVCVEGEPVTIEGRFYFTADGKQLEFNGKHYTTEA